MVEPVAVEQIAETGVASNLLKEGILVAKPYVDFAGVDLVVSDFTSMYGFVQVKGRQTAKKKQKGCKQTVGKMNPVTVHSSYTTCPFWFIVIYWVDEDTYMVYSGQEFLHSKYVKNKDGVLTFNIKKSDLKKFKDVDVLGNFNKIALSVRNISLTEIERDIATQKRLASELFSNIYKNRDLDSVLDKK